MASWQVAAEVGAALGEGPVWDDATATLSFVDVTRPAVHRLAPGTGDLSTALLTEPVSAAIPRVDGGYVLALAHGIHLADATLGSLRLAAPVGDPSDPTQRMNDAKCDPRGRLWAGTIATDFRPGISTLYRFGPDGAEPVLPGCALANGMGWSPDGFRMYFVDSRARVIHVFDYDPDIGSIRNRRTFVAVPESDGYADGLAVDAEGHVWVALYLGSRVHRYAPDGSLVGTIEFPVRKVTSVCFGGPQLTDLYVTSASAGLTAGERAEQPLAGHLFVVPGAGVGLPGARFDPATIAILRRTS